MRQLRHDLLPLVLMAAIILGTLVVFWKLLDVVVLSISLAVVLYPLHARFSRSLNRYFSAALVTTLVFLALAAVLALSYMIISANSGTVTEIIGTIRIWVSNPATDPRIFGLPFERLQVASWLTQAETLFVRYLYTVTADLPMIALKMVVFFMSLYIFLLHGIRIRDRIVGKIPDDLKNHVSTMSEATVDTLYAIYIVHGGISALTFVIAIPFFYFLGYGHVFFFSFLCALCELVPVLGSSIVFIFLGTYALSVGDINGVLILFFFGYLGVSALPEIYIRPVLMGRRVRLHPVIMLVGFIGGVITMGMAGFVLGPVLIVLLFTGYKILIEERKEAVPRQDPGT